MANMISGFRMICSLLILFFPAFSKGFYFFYILGGISDAVDGTVARRLNQVSDFGSKIDTGADILFVFASLMKVLTAIYIPVWLWIWIAVIALIKIINIVSGLVKYKEFVAVHTVMNKVCGVLVYLIPLYIKILPWQVASLFVVLTCILATFAAIQEGYCIRSGEETT